MKIKFLTLVIITTTLLSCGESNNSSSSETNEGTENPMDVDTIQPFNDTLSYGITGIDKPDVSQPEVLSKIFGSIIANEIKFQGFSFLNPNLFIDDLKKYRTENKIDLSIEEINSRLIA